MSTVSTTDFQELKALIINRFNEVDKKISVLEEKINGIDNRLKTVKTLVIPLSGLEPRIKTIESEIIPMAERVGELKNWRQIALIVITATFGTVFGWVIKGGRL